MFEHVIADCCGNGSFKPERGSEHHVTTATLDEGVIKDWPIVVLSDIFQRAGTLPSLPLRYTTAIVGCRYIAGKTCT